MAEYLSKEDMSTGEYISRDEALRALHQYCTDCAISCDGVMCRACDHANAMDIISDMPTADVQPVDRWISVEDRLPEERKIVLVYDGKGAWLSWIYKGEWHDRFCTVTHWQPLPEPPETTKG